MAHAGLTEKLLEVLGEELRAVVADDARIDTRVTLAGALQDDLYCKSCGKRFSERRGTLLQDTKLPQETVVRIVKCVGHGCSMEAAADICDVDPRSVERLLKKAGERAENFHQLQSMGLNSPEAVEMDELHGRVSPTDAKKKSLPTT